LEILCRLSLGKIKKDVSLGGDDAEKNIIIHEKTRRLEVELKIKHIFRGAQLGNKIEVKKDELIIYEFRDFENSIVTHRCKDENEFNNKIKHLEGKKMGLAAFNRMRRQKAAKKTNLEAWYKGLGMIDLRNIAKEENVEVPGGVKSKKALIELIEENRK
jgi:hypothetical protein